MYDQCTQTRVYVRTVRNAIMKCEKPSTCKQHAQARAPTSQGTSKEHAFRYQREEPERAFGQRYLPSALCKGEPQPEFISLWRTQS